MYKDRINIKNKVETSDILTSKQGYLQLARAEKFQITHILYPFCLLKKLCSIITMGLVNIKVVPSHLQCLLK